MTKKNRLYLVGGVLLVVAAVGLLWWSPWEVREPPEPVYDGKPISYWLTNSRLDSVYLRRTLSGAASWPTESLPQSLLTNSNAAAVLIKALKRDSWFGAAIYRKHVWPIMPAVLRTHLPPPIGNAATRTGAAEVLDRMGLVAGPAVPSLIKALKEDDDKFVRIFATEALGRTGSGDAAVTAALMEALKDKDVSVRYSVSNALWQVDPGAAVRAGVKPAQPPQPPSNIRNWIHL
jgi:hypothetical protein